MNIENLENEIQSWVAKNSFGAADADQLLPVVDANELAEVVSQFFKKLEGCVVVPVEPTEEMVHAFEKGMLESEHFFGEFEAFNDGYKAMVEAARGGNE